jgi:hypothetical protein
MVSRVVELFVRNGYRTFHKTTRFTSNNNDFYRNEVAQVEFSEERKGRSRFPGHRKNGVEHR